jgi:hypothetical protein
MNDHEPLQSSSGPLILAADDLEVGIDWRSLRIALVGWASGLLLLLFLASVLGSGGGAPRSASGTVAAPRGHSVSGR